MEHLAAHILTTLPSALLMALAMAWKVGWSLVLGFIVSAALQELVSRQAMTGALGGAGARPILLATLAGAASSSCSYAAASIARSLFRGGAGLIPALAFLLASTNLVAELGIVLLVLMGWQFMLAEWVGAVVMVAIMSVLVRATYPAALAEAARTHGAAADAMPATPPPGTLYSRLGQRATWARIARNFRMDAGMLWQDIVLGFAIAGALSAFVPGPVWSALFVHGAPPWLAIPVNALLGPLVAMLSFVCSIGNVPMAAILWGSGVSFGGVLAFLFADLIVLPLLDAYRRAFGLGMAAYIGVIFYVTMVSSALLVSGAFSWAGLIPAARPTMPADMLRFSIDYTFWLNLVFFCAAACLLWLSRKAPAMKGQCCH